MNNKNKFRGRPVSQRETQSKRLQVLVTEAEFETIKSKAFDAHQTISSYCREVILKAVKQEVA
jgi:hypothetical protein